MTQIIIHKTCPKCKKRKAISGFSKRSNGKPDSFCKGCKNLIKRIKSNLPLVYPSKSIVENFWKQVVKTNKCWIWQGYKDENGYGRFSLQYRTVLAHRLSYFIVKGRLPLNNACHACDNPSCVNPDCLFDGTQADNIKDMVNKGRNVRGEQHSQSKLKESDVSVIKSLLKQNIKQSVIAEMYDVNQSAISDIKRKITWKWVL